jgi:hypothetical protein
VKRCVVGGLAHWRRVVEPEAAEGLSCESLHCAGGGEHAKIPERGSQPTRSGGEGAKRGALGSRCVQRRVLELTDRGVEMRVLRPQRVWGVGGSGAAWRRREEAV